MMFVKKPWGEEYRVEINQNVAMTHLLIEPNQSTSLHCHPTKTTSMLCLEGEGTIEFFNSTFKLEPTLGFTIRNGLFHRIINKLDNQQLVLLEFENPIDKNDLVRFSDSYGRESLPYEQHSFHTQSGVLISKIFEMVNTGGLLSGNGWEAEILFYPFEINYQIEDTYVVINGYMFDDITSKIVLRPADCIGKRTLARLLERFQASHDLTILNLRPISKE